jgi:hypothetical protein
MPGQRDWPWLHDRARSVQSVLSRADNRESLAYDDRAVARLLASGASASVRAGYHID